MPRLLRLIAPCLALIAIVVAAPQPPLTNPAVVLHTTKGDIHVELFPDKAPATVANFLAYVDAGHFTDTIFHRVIDKMLIQGGGYTLDFKEKPTRVPIPLESDNGLLNLRGTIAMARLEGKDTATAQFYINAQDNPEFDRTAQQFGYAVFGRVIAGMDVVDRIAAVQTSRRGPIDDVPILPVIIESAEIAPGP